MPRRFRRIARPLVLFRWLGAAVLLAIAVSYIQPVRAYLGARDELADDRAELISLLKRQEALRRRVAEAETDAFIEREARRLGLVRQGERLFVITGVEDGRSPPVR